jgi:hypothetical protein
MRPGGTVSDTVVWNNVIVDMVVFAPAAAPPPP